MTRHRLWILAVVVILATITPHESSRILALFPFNGRSHHNVFEPILLELAARGHHVDVVTHFPRTGVPRYTCYNISDTMPSLTNSLVAGENVAGIFASLADILTVNGRETVEAALMSPVFRQVLDNDAYDLVITEVFSSDFMVAFGHYFRAPVVGVTSSVALPWGNDRFGNVDNPSYIPNYFQPSSANMGLWERVTNTFAYAYTKIAYEIQSNHAGDRQVERFFGTDVPPLSQLVYNMSLWLVNSHFSINQPRPFSPTVVEIGGVHIKPARNLTGELATLVDKSNGVIFFTLGTMIQINTLERADLDELLSVFGRLPFTVLLKGNVTLFPKDLPGNVHVRDWLPQMDILCHPKMKLFMTHGGLLGSQEAVYCGVPLLGIPLFADQYLNLKNFKELGVAEILDYPRIRLDAAGKINRILNDNGYKKRMMELSVRFRDRPMSALDTAIFWIEYVLRHRGASHLKPASVRLYWFQQHLLDVVGCVLAVIFVGVLISLWICRRCWRVVGCRKITKID